MLAGNLVVIMGCFALLTFWPFWPVIGDSKGKDQGSFSTYTISPGQSIRKSFSITEPKVISVTVTTDSDRSQLGMFLTHFARPLLNISFTGQFELDFSPSVGIYNAVITNQGSESIEAKLDVSYLVLISEKTSSIPQFITTLVTLILVLGSALATVAIINPRIRKQREGLDSNYFPEQVSGNNK